jgi:hypothetical protein
MWKKQYILFSCVISCTYINFKLLTIVHEEDLYSEVLFFPFQCKVKELILLSETRKWNAIQIFECI